MVSEGSFVLTERELAARLRLRPATVRRWRQRGQGPPYLKLPGRRGAVRYAVVDVEAWLEVSLRRSTR